jgi:hypothetical protein
MKSHALFKPTKESVPLILTADEREYHLDGMIQIAEKHKHEVGEKVVKLFIAAVTTNNYGVRHHKSPNVISRATFNVFYAALQKATQPTASQECCGDGSKKTVAASGLCGMGIGTAVGGFFGSLFWLATPLGTPFGVVAGPIIGGAALLMCCAGTMGEMANSVRDYNIRIQSDEYKELLEIYTIDILKFKQHMDCYFGVTPPRQTMEDDCSFPQMKLGV